MPASDGHLQQIDSQWCTHTVQYSHCSMPILVSLGRKTQPRSQRPQPTTAFYALLS